MMISNEPWKNSLVLNQYKGIDLLLESFEIASKQDQHLTLIIAGKCQTEKLLTRYQQRISQIPSRKRIRFDPEYVPTEKVPWYFVASDLVALPYINIDHSGIVHLAYSFGRPVIATEEMAACSCASAPWMCPTSS